VISPRGERPMKIVSVINEDATITISFDDLGFLQSAINET
jgi:hypothetical protein